MLIDDIIKEWDVDSKIDQTELGSESTKIPSLHNKYYKYFVHERLRVRRLETQMKSLKLDKYEFFTQGHTDETMAKGWKLPPKGMILKADIPMYLDADKDIIELSLKIGYHQEVVDFLDSILKNLQNRSFMISNGINWVKFTNGG